MSITVKQLIKELKNFPSDSLVGMAAMDNGGNELEGHVEFIETFDPEKSFDKDFCKNTFVVLRG
jgi:hypothetical protein